MQVDKVVILSLEEAIEAFIQWNANMIVSDRQHLVEMMRSQKLPELCHDPKSLTPTKMADLFAELNIGEDIALVCPDGIPGKVLVEVKPDTFELVWAFGNVEPNRLGELERRRERLLRLKGWA